MAMSAQQYLATLPPQEQQQVLASLQSSGSSIEQWFQAAINAGDPRAVRAAGGQPTEGGDGVGVTSAGNDQPTSAWLGQRKPSPSELVTYYRETGKSEDFARFSAAQVADWINRKWDVAGGHFTNDFGDIVEKPTESGARSRAAGFATGERDAGRRGPGGPGGPGGGPADAGGPLANALFRAWATSQGRFGSEAPEGGTNVATQLPGGALWWGSQAGEAPPAAAPAAAPPAASPVGTPPVPGAAPAPNQFISTGALSTLAPGVRTPAAPGVLPVPSLDINSFVPRTPGSALQSALLSVPGYKLDVLGLGG